MIFSSALTNHLGIFSMHKKVTRNEINPFQPSAVFHIVTSYLIWTTNDMTSFLYEMQYWDVFWNTDDGIPRKNFLDENQW